MLFWRCFSIGSHKNTFPVKSWFTLEGYQCITLAFSVQEGILFGCYFFFTRSQGVAALVSEYETSRLVYCWHRWLIVNTRSVLLWWLPLPNSFTANIFSGKKTQGTKEVSIVVRIHIWLWFCGILESEQNELPYTFTFMDSFIFSISS